MGGRHFYLHARGADGVDRMIRYGGRYATLSADEAREKIIDKPSRSAEEDSNRIHRAYLKLCNQVGKR